MTGPADPRDAIPAHLRHYLPPGQPIESIEPNLEEWHATHDTPAWRSQRDAQVKADRRRFVLACVGIMALCLAVAGVLAWVLGR